jgi:flagellar motor switch protein FliN/FliY
MSGETQVGPSTTSTADPDAATSTETSGGAGAGAVLVTKNDSELASASEALPLTADSTLARLPLQLDVTIPFPSFRVEDLLALEKGTVLESEWHHTDDVPVWCGGTQLAWMEFEVVDVKLAVRVTRIS